MATQIDVPSFVVMLLLTTALCTGREGLMVRYTELEWMVPAPSPLYQGREMQTG